ncbi:hypothetical protein Taro_039793, partial [Colocasia esculenta]|nr:hypothetical protein [Colocasia esculenta]
MGKQKVPIRRRHKQTPKALISPTDHVASGAEVKMKRYVNNPLISRCSLHIYMKDKEQINFRECHKELMKATPFAPYVDIPPMKCFGISLLEEILAHHEVGNVFNIRNKSLPFTVEDVALILGMPCTEFLVHHYGSSIEVSKLHKRFGKDTSFTRQVIHGHLIDIVGSDEKEDIEDTMRLWILLLLSTFLAPRSALSQSCPFIPQNNGCLKGKKEASTPAVSINAQMAALVDALKAAEESRKAENEEFRQKLESLMTQVEGFAKSATSLRQEKEKLADVPPSDPPCEAAEKKDFEEEMIDCPVQLLEEGCLLSDYKKGEYLPTLIVSSIHTRKPASISQKVQRLFECFPAATDLEHLGKLDFLFFVLHTTNHWHLLVVDLKNKCFISYKSIKGNKSYDASVRNW